MLLNILISRIMDAYNILLKNFAPNEGYLPGVIWCTEDPETKPAKIHIHPLHLTHDQKTAHTTRKSINNDIQTSTKTKIITQK